MVRDALERWLQKHEYDSLAQAQGSMSLLCCPDPTAFERASYLRILQSRQGAWALSAVEQHSRQIVAVR